ncbi:hypothetical protein M408DRAFT_20462 [Serendipita vermifera MAFF 305830]|uniref:CBM1 domain-containing protein n=1 Tax=Serendipita vermifera MAFF 305830 TaxID=933852 RepID=A0A0C3BKZ4_SERVB|nr:hypothetical protein M408DRAFT_20462 [Serendipita vermifera MAFF 305830]
MLFSLSTFAMLLAVPLTNALPQDVSSTPTTSSLPTSLPAYWPQCGGIGWTASSECIPGYSCYCYNQYWSGCEPDEFVATAPALCPDWLTSSTGRIPSATTSATRATAA